MATYGLSTEMHERIAQELYEAETTGEHVQLLSRVYPVLTTADAYAIQQLGLELRLANGGRVVGRKIGITSEGMMRMLECSMPDFGYLLEDKLIPEGGTCKLDELINPFVEGELAFIMGEDLSTGPITEEDIMRATSYVVPCFEVCDTRFHDWTFTVRDTIADDASAARFMISSSTRELNEIEPSAISMTLEKNGEVVGTATGAEVMGSPVNSVLWLANKLLEFGDCLRAGDIVLSGSFMQADFPQVGDEYTITMKGFTPLSMSFA
ncbi:MAG: fumarylacetoacetate hydrolase family protein [Eggerthellaceae bacterium]|nr:fumarylacetoacetate hydrolase family protein [Eggerthellaceae bacterium]